MPWVITIYCGFLFYLFAALIDQWLENICIEHNIVPNIVLVSLLRKRIIGLFDVM